MTIPSASRVVSVGAETETDRLRWTDTVEVLVDLFPLTTAFRLAIHHDAVMGRCVDGNVDGWQVIPL